MTRNTDENITVGHVPVSFDRAVEWVTEYTNADRNVTAVAPYAYPAYDTYEKYANHPHRITDADLLAPVLLNVRLSIRSFYGLQQIRSELEAGLSQPGLAQPLADVEDPDDIARLVKPLYAVLDDEATRPWGVQATTLSKVLHRKAPHFLVLHDVWVQACYLHDDGPVHRERHRSWANYMVEIHKAIGADLRSQAATFVKLEEACGTLGKISFVRLIDILAWKSQGWVPTQEKDNEVDKIETVLRS